MNKKTDAPIVQRILDASGIANFVRSNWTIQRNDEDKTLRLFLRLKANLVPDLVDGLQFRIQHVGPWQQSIVCAWCGTTEKTPDGVMNGNKVAKSAVKWLLDFLKGKGDVRRDEVMAERLQKPDTPSAPCDRPRNVTLKWLIFRSVIQQGRGGVSMCERMRQCGNLRQPHPYVVGCWLPQSRTGRTYQERPFNGAQPNQSGSSVFCLCRLRRGAGKQGSDRPTGQAQAKRKRVQKAEAERRAVPSE